MSVDRIRLVKRMVDGREAGGKQLACRHPGRWGELGDAANRQLGQAW
jgi:hypothetical protein